MRKSKWPDTAIKRTLAAYAVLTLLACQAQGPDAPLENYLQRLAATLELAPRDIHYTTLPRPPLSHKLQVPIESDKVDTLDFMALSGCALQITIGKRNSSLGRMARPSQRLLLELEYLRLAPTCIEQLRAVGNNTLATTLEQSFQRKQAQLPARIFNATLGGDEFRAFWLPAPAPAQYPATAASTVISALGSIAHHSRRWLAGDYRADNQDFEILLSEVAGGNAGQLLQALTRQSDFLIEANRLLQQRMTAGPLCAPGIRHAAANTLPDVTRKYFAGEIQTQAAQLERRAHELLPAVTTLEALLANALPPLYQTWQEDRDALFSLARFQPRRHAAWLDDIQAPCATGYSRK